MAGLKGEEEKKVRDFIRKHGVTKCPGYGDPKLAKLHKKRMKEYDAASMAEKSQMVRKGIIP